jgi:hypothetical protein
MRVFRVHDQLGTLTTDQFAEAIRLIDSVFRRAVCGEQTRGYWQVFANLAYSIDPKHRFDLFTVALARHEILIASRTLTSSAKPQEQDMYVPRILVVATVWPQKSRHFGVSFSTGPHKPGEWFSHPGSCMNGEQVMRASASARLPEMFPVVNNCPPRHIC